MAPSEAASPAVVGAPGVLPARGAAGVSTAYGTFGELLQGVLPGRDGDFLVTLPIARWSMATFETAPGTAQVQVRPAHKWKAWRLVRMLLDVTGSPDGGVLTIRSSLPEGKGLASSSADLVATARAVGNALGVVFPARLVERLLRRIEPTDGVLYPGIVAVNHRTVRLRGRLGSLPMLTVVGVDEGGTVDTVAFNRIAKPFSVADRWEYTRLLERLAAAVAGRDLAAVGAVATRSARMNQVLRHKRLLDSVVDICADAGGLGVVAAHSGTMLGILLDPRDPRYPARVAAVARACAALTPDVALYRTLSFD